MGFFMGIPRKVTADHAPACVTRSLSKLRLHSGGLWTIHTRGRAAAGPEQYQGIRVALGSLPGRLLLVLISLAFFVHLANGIRHLVWDLGYGFEKRQANASAWFVVVLAAALTILFWVFAS